ncbi:rod shape-determining protein MreC [Treponema sp. OMZ 840]|uniref:rod shape-determining protein MreC n=1 Tax=Treponema sp. OMZ 840 TaxID=244313 RepID=UPI003D8B973D
MGAHKLAYSSKFSLIILAILLIVSALILGLSTGNFVINFKQTGFSVISTAQRGVNSVVTGFKDISNAIRELSNLKKEYEQLTEKLKNYEYMQRSNAEIKKENERLSALLHFSQRYEYKNLPARIIGRDSDNLYSAIVVNKGSKDGIKKNMPVIAVQKGSVGLVGKIVTVGPYTSMIMPIYDFQCSVSARIQHTRDLGLISGTGSPDTPLKMDYIKKRVLDQLQFGDIIVTSGENGNYIREIPIGTVNSVATVDYDTSLAISVIPIVDFSRLEEVIVVDTTQKNTLETGALQ